MIVLIKLGATEAEIESVASLIREFGVEPLVLPGEDRAAVGIPAALTNDQRVNLESALGTLPQVSKVTQTSRPYKLASREFHPADTVVRVKGVEIGSSRFVVMAGPCSVESREQFLRAAEAVKAGGASVVRGGAFKPRTSPYAFQGLAEEGLKIIHEVGELLGLVTISEVMSPEMVPLVSSHVDILQIGARSMQNFPLLVEAGKSMKPVFLKRGPAATIDELLLAAEYVLSQGNPNVILCERGLISLDRGYTRNLLDLAAIPVLKDHTHLPVVADPSHGTGVAKYVAPMAKAALIAGADGLMVEVHPNPTKALSDGAQSLTLEQFADLMSQLLPLAPFAGRTM